MSDETIFEAPERKCIGNPILATGGGWCGVVATHVCRGEHGEWWSCEGHARAAIQTDPRVTAITVLEWWARFWKLEEERREREAAEDAAERLVPEVKVGQVWRLEATNVLHKVLRPNDEGKRESPSSWVMSTLDGGHRVYMHRAARLRGEWVLVEPAS